MVQSTMDPQNSHASYRAAADRPVGEGASLLNWVGAILSLALIAGLITWGYQLAVRDVSGVPVVRALDGPMRVQPDNPGGRVAEHQGLSVNAVQSAGAAEAPAERLVLAPEAADLADEDQPQTRLVNPEPTPSGEADGADRSGESPAEIPSEAPIDPIEAAVRLANEITAGAEPLGDVANDGAGTNDGPGTGLQRSLIPPRRPAASAAQPAAAVDEATRNATDTPTAIAASAVPSGTRLVQLGAPDTPEAARQLWADLSQGSFRPLMEDKQMLIQKAVSGGKTFYRLRAMGFADLSDARRFCAALVAERAECIPVVAR